MALPVQNSQRGPSEIPARRRTWRRLIAIIAIGLLAAGAIWLVKRDHGSSQKPDGRSAAGQAPVPVVVGTVEQKDVPIYLDGLGTIQALNTVTVRARVDGEIKRVAFTEGQDVHAGDLLVQIDDGPTRTQFEQASAKKAQDEAQLENARVDLNRDQEMIAKKVISPQQFDTQKALVKQLEATVRTDAAAIESAKVQLDYTKVVSPIDGRTGIRLIDQGNIVHANDQTGLVVVTQLQPLSLVFTLPEQNLGAIHKQQGAGEELTAVAVDRDNKTVLDQGTLSVIDNQIDTTTGTIRLKATFANKDFQLWPGQFVNARLLLTVRKGGLVVPASVVQRGPQGAYAFVIKSDQTVEIRPVEVAQIEQGQALISKGLESGEQVVVDGQYKLQGGTRVQLSSSAAKAGGPTEARTPDKRK